MAEPGDTGDTCNATTPMDKTPGAVPTSDNTKTDGGNEEEEMEYIMGIDEAGRGPVLGSMVYGACICPVSRMTDLKKCGFNDSKLLKESQRDYLWEHKMLKLDYIDWLVDVIPPDWMSSQMFAKNRFSLNEISHNSAMNLIRYACNELKFNITRVYLDTVGSPESYEHKLNGMFVGYNIKFIVKCKADQLFPVVSAASIAAKVTRDRVLAQWTFREKNIRKQTEKVPAYQKDNDVDNETDIDIDKDIGDSNGNEENDSNGNSNESNKENTAGAMSESKEQSNGDDSENYETDSDLDDVDIDAAKDTKLGNKATTKGSKNKKSKNTKKKKKGKKRTDNKYGDLGNGYPGDELTKKWLVNNIDATFGFPSIVRFSWQTCKTLIARHCCNVKWSDELPNNNLMKFGFFSQTTEAEKRLQKRSPFFRKRNLNVCISQTAPF